MKKKTKIDTSFKILLRRSDFTRLLLAVSKKDSFATIELSALKNADYDFVGVNKKIFGRDINKEFRQIQNEFRNRVLYPLTHPWQ